MSDIQLEIRQRFVGVLEGDFAFAGEADDDIGADRDARNAFADLGNQLAVLAVGVAAPHHLEDFVIACLQRDLNVGHDLRKRGDGVNQLGGHPIGVGGQKAQPQQVGNFGKVSEQLRQVITAFQVLTKAVNDLPEQNELLSAAGDEAAGFLENFFRVAAAFFSAFARNDAVSAGVRAAKYHWQIFGDRALLAAARQRPGERRLGDAGDRINGKDTDESPRNIIQLVADYGSDIAGLYRSQLRKIEQTVLGSH